MQISPQELSFVIEAWLFAHARPLTPKELRPLTRKLLAQSAALLRSDNTETDATSDIEAEAQAQVDAELAAEAQADAEQEAQNNAELAAAPSTQDQDAQQEQQEGDEAFALTSPQQEADEEASAHTSINALVREALGMLELRWQDEDDVRGVQLVRIGDGYTFRTNARYARRVRLLRDERPPRLTRPALESLAIVAYRQPVTKPDIDHLRGVDSGGVMKILLERNFIEVLGKRDEPGRPLLYGTTPTFLSFFNLASLDELPSLREFDELNDEAAQALRAFEGLPSLKELSEQAKQLAYDDGREARDLDDVVADLNRREGATREALMAQGVSLGANAAEGHPVH